MEYALQQKVNKLSKTYNYFNTNVALKLFLSMSEKEKSIVLNTSEVKNTILSIDDIEVLRLIFKNSPAFFQEIMFENKCVQNRLLSPRGSLKRKDLFENYNKKDFVFSKDELRQLERFLHSIRSDKIRKQVVENKLFQRIIVLCYDTQLTESFFEGLDEVQLFNNIVNDDEIFKTRKNRRRSVIKLFNNVSNHILLSEDYKEIIDRPKELLKQKRWLMRNLEHIYIDDKTLSICTSEMIEELLEFDNIDSKNIEAYLRDDIINKMINNNYDFNIIFPNLIQNIYNCFNGIDYIYFRKILEECEKNEDIKNKFLDFVYGILFNTNELDEDEINILKENLYKKLLNDEISELEYKELFYSSDPLKTIMFLKIGKLIDKMEYIKGISCKQIIYLNIKHFNKIQKKLNIENEDELAHIYSNAIKMYFTFGLERTLKILNGDYGNIDRVFFDNVSSLEVSSVKLIKEGSKYIPVLSDEFIKFMFNTEKDNHFINMLDDKTSYLNKYWSYLFNNYDVLKEKCHGIITLKKLNIIFKQTSPSRDINDVSPDNYKLKENDILNDVCLGNKTRKTNEEVYSSLLKIYEKMKYRVESSIPYVKGDSKNGYYYEMMRLNDPIIFTLGYKGNCCIRVNDIAHNHLMHAALCRNGRILLIYNSDNELAAFVPLKRNGEVLIANSIECAHKKRNERAIETFMDAVKDIVYTSQSNKSEDNPINLVCIGTEAYARPEGIPFPSEIETPTIFEKNDSTYSGTDKYHKQLTIIYKNKDLKLSNLKYGNPKCSYLDPRESIMSCDFNTSSSEDIEKALNVINAVKYTNCDLEQKDSYKKINKYGIVQCIYNEDWYIFITYDGKIHGEYLEYDERAKNEYMISMDEISNQYNNSSFVKKLKRCQ